MKSLYPATLMLCAFFPEKMGGLAAKLDYSIYKLQQAYALVADLPLNWLL